MPSHKDGNTSSSTPNSRPPVTIMTNSSTFSLGQIVATPGALALLAETNRSAASLIARHMHGDWGDICKEDTGLNELAVRDGFRILSVYRLVDAEKLKATPVPRRTNLPTIWIITDAADDHGIRRCTTLLLPGDY